MPSQQAITLQNLQHWIRDGESYPCGDRSLDLNPLRDYELPGESQEPPAWINTSEEAGWSYFQWSDVQWIGIGSPMFDQVYCVALFTLVTSVQLNDNQRVQRQGCHVDMMVASL
jgi:hypothetical protein